MVAASSARANDLPIKTNPNLVHFGYYYADSRYGGPFHNEVFPYTNLFIPVGLNPCFVGRPAFLADYGTIVQTAFNNSKDIYAILGPPQYCTDPAERILGFSPPAFTVNHRQYLAEGAQGGLFNTSIALPTPTPRTRTRACSSVARTASSVRSTPCCRRSRGRRCIRRTSAASRAPSSPRSWSRIVAERTMLWGSPWHEGHTVAGTATTGTAWAVAGIETGLTFGSSAFVLVANTSTSAGSADVMVMFGDNNCLGTPPACTVVRKTISLAPQSRTTLDLPAEFPSAFTVGRLVGIRVESNGVPIVVEHAQYSNAVPFDGLTWTAGGAARATRLF